MPVILACHAVTLDLADLASRQPIYRHPLPRSPGIHQSGILHYIGHKVGWLKPEEWDDADKGVGAKRRYPWRWALGIAFEEFWFSLTAKDGVQWQPGEREKDGIVVNCDGLGLVSPAYPCVDETKRTEKKVRTPEEFLKENMWLHQNRAYCEVYGPRIGRFTVMYARGDYKGSGPVCMQYVVGYSDKECKDTWNMLVANREFAEAE